MHMESRKKGYKNIPRAIPGGDLDQSRYDNQGFSGNREISDTERQQPGSNHTCFESKQLETLINVFRDPPFARARVHKEPDDYNIPPSNNVLSLRSGLDNLEANIVQFLRAGSVFKTIQATRKVREVIYRAGPTKLMQTATAMQRAVDSLDGDLGEVEPDFTWVHLPATNVRIPRVYN